MMLNFEKSVKMLKKYKIKVAGFEMVKKREKVSEAAKKVGFPLVEKFMSPQIIHKTEGGFVNINVKNAGEATEVFDKFLKKAGRAKLEGVLLQKRLDGNEVIIGGKTDMQFGPVVLFGLGGIFTETLKDFSLRVAPIDEKEAHKMILEIKGYPVLAGGRGRKPANIGKLAKTIAAVSRLMANEKVRELDLNPCFAGSDCIAADVRVIM